MISRRGAPLALAHGSSDGPVVVGAAPLVVDTQTLGSCTARSSSPPLSPRSLAEPQKTSFRAILGLGCPESNSERAKMSRFKLPEFKRHLAHKGSTGNRTCCTKHCQVAKQSNDE